jgi:hypothetical protein
MSPNALAAGGIGEVSEPRHTRSGRTEYSIRYNRSTTVVNFNVDVSTAPPENLLLDIEVESEDGAYSLRAVQVDVTVEEDDPGEAFLSLTEAVKGWLEYLTEEDPVLAPDLESQRRYTRLLHYAPDTWFGRLLIS